MKHLFVVLGILSLLACSDSKQAVNQKESLPEGMSEVVFNQVMTQPWILDGFNVGKKTLGLLN